MRGLTQYIAAIELEPPRLPDLVVEARALAPNETIGEVPPAWALQQTVLQAHQTRLHALRIGGYLAAHYAWKLFDALPDTPEAAATVLTRSARRQLRAELNTICQAVLARLANEVEEACNREIYRYEAQLICANSRYEESSDGPSDDEDSSDFEGSMTVGSSDTESDDD